MKLSLLVIFIAVLICCKPTKRCSEVSKDCDYISTILRKDSVASINQKSAYSADVLITDSNYRNPIAYGYCSDQFICLALEICKENFLIEANFITDTSALSIMNIYGIQLLTHKALSESEIPLNEYVRITQTCFGSFKAKKLTENWDKQLKSKNVTFFPISESFFNGERPSNLILD